jgi:glycosyltransferase involved in cell wall biosynthesis
MKDGPLITIGIPTYNRPEKLKRTLDSIITQNYKNLDIHISDNCSTSKDTQKVISSFIKKDKRLRVVRQKKNIGAVNNFNYLSRNSKGNYFMWIADDMQFSSKDLLEKLMDKMIENDNYVLVFPDFNKRDLTTGEIFENTYSKIYGGCKTDYDYLSKAVRKSTYEIYGLFNLAKLKDAGIPLRFNMGEYEQATLHRVFVNGGARFVSGVSITYDIEDNLSTSLHPAYLLLSMGLTLGLLTYLKIYIKSKYSYDIKLRLYMIILLNRLKYSSMLLVSCFRLRNIKRLLKSNWIETRSYQ